MPAPLLPTTPHAGVSSGACNPVKIGTFVVIGVFSGFVEIVSAGQLPQVPTDSRHAPSTLQQKPGSPLVTKRERKPYESLFLALRSRLELEKAKKGPALLDSFPSPTRRSGPCGLVFLDERRGIDPHMIVPVPPGDFAIRSAVPETCRKD
jgi:hypothetical protein